MDFNSDLSHNRIGNSGARGIAKLLSSPKSSLITLKLNNNQIANDGIKRIGKALQQNKVLETLELRLNHLYDEGGYSILVLLLKNSNLRELDLSGNGLESKSAKALCVLLKANIPSLVKLDLSCNKLGEYAEKNISESNNNLRELKDLQKVDDATGKAIFEAISLNKVINRNKIST
jgi:Ran GTPase-activating protein (RanGAP) involved in mRNA processing and transport